MLIGTLKRGWNGGGIDALVWTSELAGKLLAEFGGRVAFVGIQGSRARGEAREGSDIDADDALV